mmetsp:Transcript_21233/g.46335  ORF Transcript_21233/g.46335 Transcript_21233/m.46335 type:complete len:204 (-) Transcript_21233:310-921(-)|eukprot:CAMPEP_0168171838 /NCGR_PEP_ID=MMETSP0139_2-20121125/4914_1 /TAXON_ID=44445 /ORGANISM="Pseudo-nitzschia australis, Strain 10249 10 AB" /LENGTH=203 /DNA_ID=CAMNT_0008089409 /DNA_START=127 /DNA_END=738 /DNA_ORIENTATION=+
MSYYETVEDIEESEGEEVEEESEVEEEEVPKRRKQKKWKDPNKPKRAMSAFFCYSQAERPNVKITHPDASFGDVARILSAQYKALTDKEMKKFVKKAAQDKVRYQEEMKNYIPMDDPTGGKRKKAKKDPNAPKRNMSAYFLFSVFVRPSVKEENPEAAFGDIARIISAQYKTLDAKEREKWDNKAAADKERYQRQMEAYRAGL